MGTQTVLFVEGHHDLVFVETLVQQIEGHRLDFDVRKIDGKSSMWRDCGVDFKNAMQSAIESPDTGAVGLILDADECSTETWRLVKKRVNFPGLGIVFEAQRIAAEGFVQTFFVGARAVAVGVWIMPDNTSVGQLEDLISRMIPQHDLAKSCAESYIDDLPIGLVEIREHQLPKHYIHAWLSAYCPGDSFDTALEKRLLEVPDADPVIQRFLGRLRQLMA